MKLEIPDVEELRPLLSEFARSLIAEFRAEEAKVGERLGYTEKQAADALGIPQHVLGDARRRGEVSAARIGKQYVYPRDELLRFVRGENKANVKIARGPPERVA